MDDLMIVSSTSLGGNLMRGEFPTLPSTHAVITGMG